MKRYWIASAVLAVAVSGVLALLLETGLRASGYGYPTAFFLKIPGREAYTTNQKYGWRFFPPPMARTPVVCDLPAQKAPNTYRIFVLGESAAMGIPEPALSFGKILIAMLKHQYPGVHFELVNAAMTAISSHIMRPIAADCAHRQPDLFVVYAGNNEVVGPYGAGTVFTAASPSLPLLRAGIWFQSTLTAELVENTAARLRKPETRPRDWGGMSMFLDHQVPADDPRMEKVYANFAANLADVCRIGRSAGTQVIVSTVATNLKGCAPFASVHRSESNLAGWQALYNAAIEQAKSGDHQKAVDQFVQAARLDDRFAELHFRLGKSLLALNRTAEAREHFIQARDLDALRFRADTRINEAIREVASKLGVRLADTERAFDQTGIPGDELLYEHVHLTFSGNYLLAKTVLGILETDLPAWIKNKATGPAQISESEAAELMTMTSWDRYRADAAMLAMISEPPFSAQFDFAEKKAAKQRALIPPVLSGAEAAYRTALSKDPDDMDLRTRLAQSLSRNGNHAASAEEWRALIARVPGVARWHDALADELRDQQKLNEALDQERRALQLDPQLITAHFKQGEILERQGKWDEARAAFDEWLRWKPESAEAHNHLAAILRRQGRPQEAFAQYAEALRLKPDYAEVHNSWAVALESLGQIREAIPHYQEALRLSPDFAGAQANWGVALARLGQFQQAFPHYQEALRLKPDFAEVHNNWGSALEGAGDIRQAISHYQEALRLKPAFADAQINWGVALAKLGQVQAALPHFLEAQRLNPRDAEACYYSGSALENLGRIQDAAAQYSQALRINPDYARARNKLEAILKLHGKLPMLGSAQ